MIVCVRGRFIDSPYICIMRKKELRPDDQALEDWLNRNKLLVWGAVTVAAISIITMIVLTLMICF